MTPPSRELKLRILFKILKGVAEVAPASRELVALGKVALDVAEELSKGIAGKSSSVSEQRPEHREEEAPDETLSVLLSELRFRRIAFSGKEFLPLLWDAGAVQVRSHLFAAARDGARIDLASTPGLKGVAEFDSASLNVEDKRVWLSTPGTRLFSAIAPGTSCLELEPRGEAITVGSKGWSIAIEPFSRISTSLCPMLTVDGLKGMVVSFSYARSTDQVPVKPAVVQRVYLCSQLEL